MYFSSPSYLTVVALFSTLSMSAKTAGCGKNLPAAQSPPGGASHPTEFTQSDGTKRTYLIHIPSNYDTNTPAPLIFSFHGRTKNASQQEQLSQFSDEKLNPDAIAVYPQGLRGSEKKTQWQGDPNSSGVNDIAFVQDMITHLKSRYCIDDARIYAAGKSNGGGLTGLLACDPKLSTQIAAFAAVSGAFYTGDAASICSEAFAKTVNIRCNPGRKVVPILEFHGLADDVVSYTGGAQRGGCLPDVAHWVDSWVRREGFSMVGNVTSSVGGKVLKYEYGGGDGREGVVTHITISDLKHAWPSTQPNDDSSTPSYIDATPIIMKFFYKYTLDTF